MNIIDNIRTFFVNILEWIKGAFNITPKEIIDPEVAFLAKLDTKGYTFDENKNWYVRTQTTNNGKESCLEVYQKDEESNWKAIMYGDDGNIFYEHPVEI